MKDKKTRKVKPSAKLANRNGTANGLQKTTSLSCEKKPDVKSWSFGTWIMVTCVFVGLLSFLVGYYVSNGFGEQSYTLGWEDNKKSQLEAHIAIESHQDFPLKRPYAVDYGEVTRVRRENMRRYDYPYKVFGIDKRSKLSLQEFWDVYDAKWPVVVTDVVPNWEASKWTGKYFNDTYGDERIAMKAVNNGLLNAETLALPLHLFYKNVHLANPTTWTYIEDELFIPMKPELRRQLGENMYMNEDYFQLFPEEIRPWNAMLLWGTKYSKSSLHIDPYNWTGSSAVFMGRKRWRLYPPGQDLKLYVIDDMKAGFPLDCYKYNSVIDAYDPDIKHFPDFQKATAIEYEQLPGELLFIPTGWFHQAINLEETIAVNSQMANRNNYRIILEEIIKVGNIERKDLPKHIDIMSPVEQIEAVMNLLPQHLLDHGREVTKDMYRQVQSTVPLN